MIPGTVRKTERCCFCFAEKEPNGVRAVRTSRLNEAMPRRDPPTGLVSVSATCGVPDLIWSSKSWITWSLHFMEHIIYSIYIKNICVFLGMIDQLQ